MEGGSGSNNEPNVEKSATLSALRLSEDEWHQVKRFLQLLEIADRAQQAFSAENSPTLHNGIPALEGLHAAWTKRKDQDRYAEFPDALEAGLSKIEDYYEKTSESHAYTFAIFLDPSTKMTHFAKHWDKKLQDEIRDSAEVIFKERYEKLFGSSGALRLIPKSKNSKISRLLAELSDDDISDDDNDTPLISSSDNNSSKPWLNEFNQYLDSIDIVPKGMSLPAWWGINAQRLPVWASLARDYLAIMASSVSSECAFSSAGITISKRRNRLKGDIVEALQFLKCAIRSDLIFREPSPSIVEEKELCEVLDNDHDPEWEDVENSRAWDALFDIDSDTDDM